MRVRPQKKVKMITLTVDDIMNMKPCDSYPRSRVEKLFAGRSALSIEEIAALSIPNSDKIIAISNVMNSNHIKSFIRKCSVMIIDYATNARIASERAEHASDCEWQLAIGISSYDAVKIVEEITKIQGTTPFVVRFSAMKTRDAAILASRTASTRENFRINQSIAENLAWKNMFEFIVTTEHLFA